MADESGRIQIDVVVDSSEAARGLGEIGAAVDATAADIEALGSAAEGEFDRVDDAAREAVSGLSSLASQAAVTDSAVEQLGGGAGDTIEGLDGLKDSSAEVSSSMGQLGGAIGVVNPELGSMVSGLGALAGGMEGASKATALFKAQAAAMLAGLAPILPILAAAAAATWALSRANDAATESEKALIAAQEGRLSSLSEMTSHVAALRTEEALATGQITELEAAIERVTARRDADTRAIQQARSAANALTGEARANALAEVEVMEARRDEIARLGAMEASRANVARLQAEQEMQDQMDLAAAAAARADAEAAAGERRAAAADAAALNHQRELELLAELDPALANYLRANEAINAEVERGLSPANERLSRLRAERELIRAREAAELEVKLAEEAAAYEAAEAQKQAALEATIALEEVYAANREAVSMAISGFLDLAMEMERENAQAQKALASAEIIIAGLVAGAQALKLGPVAGPIAAAGVAASTTASLMKLEATAIPTMHEGGIVGGDGDIPIRAQGGEAILNRNAVSALGEEGVETLNAGGGAGGAVVVELTYRQRMFDRVVFDNLRKGGPLGDALNQAERRGRRGRVGGLVG